MNITREVLPPSPFGHLPNLPWALQQDCSGWRDDAPSWRPPTGLEDLHVPVIVASLWRRLLAVVRDPVQVVEEYGRRTVQIVGVIRLLYGMSGQVHAYLWRDRDGRLTWDLCPPQEIVLQALPASWSWLDLIQQAASREIAAHLRSRSIGFEDVALAKYSQALFDHFRRSLTRHADLRVMRARVSAALALDGDAVRLARHLINVPTDQGSTRLSYYNDVRRHQAALMTLEREVPAAVPLYAALVERADFKPSAEPGAALRSFLLGKGFAPRAWRLLTRVSRRFWLPIRSFYRGDAGDAMLDYLRIIEALQIDREPPAWLAWCLLSQVANPEFRHPEHFRALSRYMAPLAHTAREYMRGPDTDSRRCELARIVNWLSVTAPSLDKRQRSAGWAWLVRESIAWSDEQSQASDVPWPVPCEQFVHGEWVCVPVDSPKALRLEGQALHHCAANFAEECVDGEVLFVSIRRAGQPQRRHATALLRRGLQSWWVGQVRAMANADPDPRAVVAVTAMARQMSVERWTLEDATSTGPAAPDWSVSVGFPPDGTFPACMPPNARLIAQVAWYWSSTNSLAVRYQLSRNKNRSLWLMWARYMDDDGIWRRADVAAWGTIGDGPAGEEDAATGLLRALWVAERDLANVNRISEVTCDGLLADGDLNDLADDVWSGADLADGL